MSLLVGIPAEVTGEMTGGPESARKDFENFLLLLPFFSFSFLKKTISPKAKKIGLGAMRVM